MKSKIKLVFAVLCLSFLFSGCQLLCLVGLCETNPGDENPVNENSEVKFSNYVVDGKKINTSTIQVVSGKSVSIDLTMNMTDKYYKWAIYKNGQQRFLDSSCSSAENVKRTVGIGTSSYAVGTEQYGEVLIYKDEKCKEMITDTNYVTKTVVVNSAPATTSGVLKALGNDKTQICKSGFLDANNNETDIGTDNLFVRIAYSQIGYKEKASNSNLNSCTGNSGSSNHQKYGKSGEAWCVRFVEWVAKKSGYTGSKLSGNTHSLDDNFTVIKSSEKSTGDLVYTSSNGNGHVGILHYYNNTWYVIHGNWDNAVKHTKLSTVIDGKGTVKYLSTDGILR